MAQAAAYAAEAHRWLRLLWCRWLAQNDPLVEGEPAATGRLRHRMRELSRRTRLKISRGQERGRSTASGALTKYMTMRSAADPTATPSEAAAGAALAEHARVARAEVARRDRDLRAWWMDTAHQASSAAQDLEISQVLRGPRTHWTVAGARRFKKKKKTLFTVHRSHFWGGVLVALHVSL